MIRVVGANPAMDRVSTWPALRLGDVNRASDVAVVPGGKGFIGKFSLSFDAQKVVFDFRQTPTSGFRIWEVNIDGSDLRQVSFPPRDEAEKVARWGKPWHTDDIHPCYLPDGKIIFSSTRCEHTVLCGGSAALVVPTLHRMNADGTDPRQLTRVGVDAPCPELRSLDDDAYPRYPPTPVRSCPGFEPVEAADDPRARGTGPSERS